MPLASCPICSGWTLHNNECSSESMQCAECGSRIPSNIFPLFIVTGASGVGKSSVVSELRYLLPECIIFDKDIVWAKDWDHVFRNWLRIAHSIAQGGRYTIICGTAVPENFEDREERNLVGTIHYINLHCSDEVREKRLRARDATRNASSDEFISTMKQLAQWLLDHATTDFDPVMPTIDTSNIPVEETARNIAEWVSSIVDTQHRQEAARYASSG